MSRLNRFRWISSVLALLFTIVGAIGTALRLYVLEAVCNFIFLSCFVIRQSVLNADPGSWDACLYQAK